MSATPSPVELRLDEATPDSPVRMADYQVLRRVGAGGFGIVYQARHRLGHLVAIKILRNPTASQVARLKREFRAVADLAHPNLCSVHELTVHEDAAFVAMEFVDGVDFGTYVRRSSSLAELATGATPATLARSASPAGRFDEPRLRATLRALAEAVNVLHDRGQLHRDLKPSNVLVDASGRVVVVDFGLIDDARRSREGKLAGTPSFMAPELLRGEPASVASDWFAFGVMMFVALTGDVPPPIEASSGPCRASALNPSVPDDLDALCTRLLSFDPAARPTGVEVAASLDVVRAPDRARRDPARASNAPFVGRRHEMAVLRQAFAEVARGGSVLQWIRAGSGMGKSALLQRFLAELGQAVPRPLVLHGRCFANESVPYKAFDAVIDALAEALRSSDDVGVAGFGPASASLTAIFPALANVLPHDDRELPPMGEAKEVRARGFQALREILAALARQRPVVIVVDDLQWGDADSAHLMCALVAGPPTPGLLVVGACRDDDARRSPFFLELGRLLGIALPGSAPTVPLGPLDADEAHALVLACLGPERPAVVEAIVAEASGSPFFIEELSRDELRRRQANTGLVERRSLEQVLGERIRALPPPARHVLELAAIAERSIDVGLAIAACSLGADAGPSLRSLGARSLVRLGGLGDDDPIEVYHDRIREAVLANLSAAELVARNGALAHCLEARGATPEVLATHFLAAREMGAALKYARAAAGRAAAVLAFDRAAQLYAIALEALDPGSRERLEILVLRAEALVNAGHCALAGDVYLDASACAPAEEALDLKRRAAEQLLVAGKVAEGTAIVRSVAREAGLFFPDSTGSAVGASVVSLARTALGGFRLSAREAPPSRRERARLATAFTAVRGISAFDMTRGAFFAMETLRLALRAGDRVSAARTMSAVGSNLAYGGGGPMVRWGQRLLSRAKSLARESGEAGVIASVDVHEGILRLTQGDWAGAVKVTSPAVQTLKDSCTGYQHERSYGEMTALFALEAMGHWRDVEPRAAACLREGDATGNLYLRVQSCLYLALCRLAADAPGEAPPLLAPLGSWPSPDLGFLFQHWLGLKAEVMHALYTGDAPQAYALLHAAWPKLRSSGLLGMGMVRVLTLHLRASAALGLASHGARYRALAARDADVLARQPLVFGHAAAHAVHAAIALANGDTASAVSRLAEASRLYLSQGMRALRAVVDRKRSALVGGPEGRALGAQATLEFSSVGIVAPERWARIHALA